MARGQQAPASAKPFDLIDWNGGKFIYGADYYPEAWPESQWEKDAIMMQEAGINFVRMGEFAWVKMEPQEGHFDFAWLDRALKVLNAHGIRAVLGTPTASPPAWLYAKYPDIAVMDAKGFAIATVHAAIIAFTTRISVPPRPGSLRPWRNITRIIPE